MPSTTQGRHVPALPVEIVALEDVAEEVGAAQLRQVTEVLAERVGAENARRAREALGRQLAGGAGSR